MKGSVDLTKLVNYLYQFDAQGDSKMSKVDPVTLALRLGHPFISGELAS